jgi:hypothetical protein
MTDLLHDSIANLKSDPSNDISLLTLFEDSHWERGRPARFEKATNSAQVLEAGGTPALPVTERAISAFQMFMSRSFTDDESELGTYKEAPHDYLREQCTFSNRTAQFLSRYAKRLPPYHHHDGSQTYYVLLHGITSRKLPGDDSTEPKYFRALMQVKVPAGADNLDQCTFKRGPRQEETKQEYLKGIEEELKGAADLPAHQGPLCFFAHGAMTGAGVSDNDALRLAMLSGVPTVNVDWRATPGPWYTLPFRYPIDYNGAVTQEKLFEPALDESFAYIGPEHAAMIGFSRGTGFDAAYMQHRFANKETCPQISANILAHADLKASQFRVREEGVNPIVDGSSNTIVLGNPHDGALRVGRIRIFGDRIGDAEPKDIATVTAAGGTYVIDKYQHRGGNFNHYIDYKVIAKMIRAMVLKEANPV